MLTFYFFLSAFLVRLFCRVSFTTQSLYYIGKLSSRLARFDKPYQLLFAGIAFYLAWVTCATAINAIVVLHYVLGVSMSSAVYGALTTLAVIIAYWFLLELFRDRQLR